MPDRIKKITQITTDSFRVEYHEERGEFELIFDPHLESEGSRVSEFHLVLPEKIVRQMAEILPPPEPESVH